MLNSRLLAAALYYLALLVLQMLEIQAVLPLQAIQILCQMVQPIFEEILRSGDKLRLGGECVPSLCAHLRAHRAYPEGLRALAVAVE